MSALVGSDSDLLEVAADIRLDWSQTGLRGGFLARDITTGEQLGFDIDRQLPLASVVKVPLALVLFDLMERGELDPTQPLQLDPADLTPGPSGLSLFEHPSTVAVGDLISMALSISDNGSTDALFDLVPPSQVTERMRAWGWHDIVVRHPIREIYRAISQLADSSTSHLLELAVRASTRGGGHVIPQLDTSHANAGTVKALVALLEATWNDRVSSPAATRKLRTAMGNQMSRHRMASELVSDLTRIDAKTGTFLNLRHEIGVVTTAENEQIAIAALTASSVAASEQPEADAAIGAAARSAVEALTH